MRDLDSLSTGAYAALAAVVAFVAAGVAGLILGDPPVELVSRALATAVGVGVAVVVVRRLEA
ncbi:MAG: hypothetical protein ABEJ88_10180 [Halobacterium sp.]